MSYDDLTKPRMSSPPPKVEISADLGDPGEVAHFFEELARLLRGARLPGHRVRVTIHLERER